MPEPAAIDHATLSRLAAAGLVRAALLVGRPGGWAVSVRFGLSEAVLAAQRSGKPRLFRRLDAAAAYLLGLGLPRFEVDAAGHAPPPPGARPDRAAALRKAHAAARRPA